MVAAKDGVVHYAIPLDCLLLIDSASRKETQGVLCERPHLELLNMTNVAVPPKLSVVVPVFNERATIEEIIRRIQAVAIEKEILIVDDGSTDGTREFLADLAGTYRSNPHAMTLRRQSSNVRSDNIRIFFQETNCGKGAALRRGFKEARGQIVIIQDADLEYDPQDFFRLIEPIERGEADVVYGSRFLGGGPHRVLLFWHYVGNKFLTTLSNMFTNLNLSDVWTCYKAFRREVLERVDLQENRFGFEQEITVKISKNSWRVYEVPISYYGRTYTQGKKITWKDGVRGLWCIFSYSLKARRSHSQTSGPPLEGLEHLAGSDSLATRTAPKGGDYSAP